MIKTTLFKNRYIAAPKKSENLMIVLHGRGDSIHPFKEFNKELKIPNMNYLLLNAPRKFLRGYTWYGEPPFQKNGVLKLREKLFQLLADLEQQGWDPSKIYFFGFSQGCLVSADIGMNYPKKLGGIIGISGYFQFFPRWRNQLTESTLQTPWLFTHGFMDDILPIETTKFGARKLQEAGFEVDWVEMEKKHVLLETEYPIIRKWVSEKLKSI